MNVFKKSRRWLCANLVLLAGMAALGGVASPTLATATPIPGCQKAGCDMTGQNCTTCTAATLGGTCGLQGGTGKCKQVPYPVGCECQ